MNSLVKLSGLAATTSLLLASTSTAQALEISGSLGADVRYFNEHSETHGSVFVEPELYWETESGDDAFSMKVFARADDTDDERSRADIRELKWQHVADRWELHTGIGKVFWGVAESIHLVDVINQTDQVQSADGEEKLGQPMVHWSGFQDWGTVDAFLLPYFRDRRFAGPDGRPSFGLTVDHDLASYESDDEEKHLDWALRYSHTLGDWDIGLSYFSGTDRNPSLIPQLNAANETVLAPYYAQIEQLGIDVQATIGSWLWKAEAIAQDNSSKDYAAGVAGFEYTLVGVAESDTDVGLLAELHRDSRGQNSGVITEKDIFLAARITLNDVQDSNLLIGVNQSLEHSNSRLAVIEGNRRFGDNWRGTIDANFFDSDAVEDPLYQLRDEDHLSVTVEYFF